ncbi:ABC transporter substrate-binding protein [Aromatoleum evansii]|uniref:ABC transporter substrate-binding protein n=1 Tax=Aromatoleum evansii TaxID=59406 RepID=UPI001FEA0F2E|nr:ABC transporter substrate-binding protein [Aromatoleum evansii]
MASRRLSWWSGVMAALACAAGPVAAIELTASEQAGKQIFLEGRSASGSSIAARVGGADTAIPATVVPCANCHGADGRGRREGGVRPPDITWRRLALSYGQRLENGRERPAYDAASFARAITSGVDAGGNRLDPAMPRFTMSARDVEDLTAYLKRLEDDGDPGLLADAVRVGTLQPAAGPLAELGATVTALLRGTFDAVNAGGGVHGRRVELVVADPGTDAAGAEAALRRLVEDEKVFAVVAPLVPALDGRLGELADAARIPVVGPLAHLTGSGGRFVFDPLPGLGEQLGALGEYAAAALKLANPPAAIVHPDEARSGAIARALAERLARRGWSQVRAYAYVPGAFDAAGVGTALAGQGAQAVFFMGRDADFGALAAQAPLQKSPPWLFAAANQVGASALQLAPAQAGRVFIAYPTLPQDWSPQGAGALRAVRERSGAGERHPAFQVGAYAAAMVMAEGLKRAGRDASRDKLVAALENLHGFQTGVTPAIGFGPGQRIGAPGAHIVGVDAQKRVFRPTGRYVRLDTVQE